MISKIGMTAVLVGALVAVLPATAAHAAQNFTVDLATTTWNVLHGANGSLYGISDDGVPSDNLLAPLKLTTTAQKPEGGAQHPNGDAITVAPAYTRNGGGDIFVNLQDYYSDWPYQNLGLSDYLSKIDTMITAMKNSQYRSKFVVVPFNEPDWIWYDLGSGSATKFDAFNADWKTAYQRIRSIDPTMRIAGPNEAYYHQAFLASFLSYAKANNVQPDVMTWHELDPSSLSNFQSHYNAYRALETSNGISARPINIDEYANRRDLSVPGQLVQWASMLENNKVYGDQAYWDTAGNLSGNTVRTNSPNSSWWFFRWYAGLTGQTVKVTPPSPNTVDTLQGTASLDTCRKQAQVLLGGSDTNTDVVLNNVPSSVFGSSVNVIVSETIWSGYEGDAPAPRVVSRTTRAVSNGSVTVPLTGLNKLNAYRIVIVPAAGAPTAPTVAWRNTYEAENSAITGGTVYTKATTSDANNYTASGGKEVGSLNQSSSKVSFTVNAPTSGTYDLDVYYGNQSGDPATQNLTIDGTASGVVSYPSTLNWAYRAKATRRITLSAGSHTIALGKGTNEAGLDRIDLTAVTGADTAYEATLADSTGNATYSYSASGEVGTGAVALTSGGKTTFDVTAPDDGYYTVTPAYSSAGGSTTLTVNGDTAVSIGSSGGSWTQNGYRLHLREGINRIALAPAGSALFSLRNLKVSATPSQTGVTTIEAESATRAGTAAVQSSSFASGGSYVGYLGNGSGNTLTFSYNAASAGRYAVILHYAQNDRSGTGNYNTNTMARKGTLNGTALTFRNTYGWHDFWGLGTTLQLNAGTNSLVFGNASGYAPDLDYIEVAPLNG